MISIKKNAEQKDQWSYWLKKEAVETRLIDIQGLRAFSKRLKVAYPKPEVILEKLSAFTLVRTDMAQTFAFEVFAIGYDFDFNPICLISMKAYDRTSLECSFREILGLLPTDDFINQDDTYLSAGIQVRYCEGGPPAEHPTHLSRSGCRGKAEMGTGGLGCDWNCPQG